MGNVRMWRVGVTSLFIVVGLYTVAVNIIKVFGLANEMQRVPYALSSKYKIFRTTVNNINVLMSSCKVLEPNVEFVNRFA
jgi:hypothetical protein